MVVRRGTARPEGGTRGDGGGLPRPRLRPGPSRVHEVSFSEEEPKITQAKEVEKKLAEWDEGAPFARGSTANICIYAGEVLANKTQHERPRICGNLFISSKATKRTYCCCPHINSHNQVRGHRIDSTKRPQGSRGQGNERVGKGCVNLTV